MKIRTTVMITGIVFVLAGCATMPTAEEIAQLDYGQPITVDCQTAVKDHFRRVLFDPYSAQYEFQEPRQFWFKESPLLGGRLYAGYMVFVGVNAKNRLGGYVGMQDYGFLFKNDEIIRVLEPGEVTMLKQKTQSTSRK